jgi:cysteine desulfurase/selenocysteine lyase
MNRDDFPILKTGIIYLDNAATTLKPQIMIDKTVEYYKEYSANAHRGDYDISLRVDDMFISTRKIVKELINAKDEKEIVFTSGTTDSLNKIVFGYFKHQLKEGDEILVTKSEHASLLLPWFELADELKLNINYIELDNDYKIDINNVKKVISDKTRVICLSQVTNVIGDIRPIDEITRIAHENNILLVVDGAQSVPHMKIDVQKSNIDFLAFSGHKLLGPTGIGVLYGKQELLNKMHPTNFGGGMNSAFSTNRDRLYREIPYKLEAGTPNVAGVIGLYAATKYLLDLGLDKIVDYESKLRKYTIEKLSKIPELIIYNPRSETGIVTINMKDIFAQDLAIYLNKYNICVRSGSHCAKILANEIGVKNTCRISLYFYNTYEEIDKLCEVLSNPNLKEEII